MPNTNNVVKVNDEQVARARKLYTGYMGETFEQFCTRIFNIALTQMEYRRDNNKKQAELRKEFREWKAQQQQ